MKYKRGLGSSVDNYNKMHGILAEIFRISERDSQKHVQAFGSSRTSLKNPTDLKMVGELYILSSPTDIYNIYHQNMMEQEIITSDKDLLLGDLIRVRWEDNVTLEYSVTSNPRSHGDSYFIVLVSSMFNTKD